MAPGKSISNPFLEPCFYKLLKINSSSFSVFWGLSTLAVLSFTLFYPLFPPFSSFFPLPSSLFLQTFSFLYTDFHFPLVAHHFAFLIRTSQRSANHSTFHTQHSLLESEKGSSVSLVIPHSNIAAKRESFQTPHSMLYIKTVKTRNTTKLRFFY